jgi:NADPH2:quinone reductase
MKAIVCREFGPPEKLVYEEAPLLSMGKGAVRVAVKAVGINFPDTLIIQGKYQFRAEPPFTPGGEFAGEVLEVGADIKHLKPGDHVAGVITYGAYAEQLVAPAAAAMPIPKDMDFTAAAAFPMIYGTSYHALKQRADLKPGETLLVLGAAGGVGLAAVQLGKLMGARVIAAAGSDEKLAICKQNGADEVINYSVGSLKEEVKRLTGGKGADVIYDPVGGDYFDQCMSCINWNGRLLVVGFASGPIPTLAINRILLKGCAVVGVFWGQFLMKEPQVNMANFHQLFQWYTDGKLKPPVFRTYPLAQAAQAMNDLLSRKTTGKLILLP